MEVHAGAALARAGLQPRYISASNSLQHARLDVVGLAGAQASPLVDDVVEAGSSAGYLAPALCFVAASTLQAMVSRRPSRRHRRRSAFAGLRSSRLFTRLFAAKEKDPEVVSVWDIKKQQEEALRRSKVLLDSQGYDSEEWKAEAQRVRGASNNPDLWNDSAKAQEVLKDLKRIEKLEKRASSFDEAAEETNTAVELAAEGDESFLEEAQDVLKRWRADIELMETEILLGGKFDASSCQVSIFAGAGGDEACDWVEMLERMYGNYAKNKGWTTTQVDFTPGDHLGKKSVEFQVDGDLAYGHMKGEHGTHRLVRVWNGKRQTTFAGVEVVPLLNDDSLADFELDANDLKFETFRSGGKGGQNVNMVETGVRVIHEPTGLTATSREERSQLLNKGIALKRLKERVLAVLEQQQVAEVESVRGDLISAQWGAQVRNYVLQPYTLVKDLRSGHERGDAERVLNGDLNSHVDAYLRTRAEESKDA
eukprot:TRINITY_DN14915_c0_g2_i1.p1 TRINITY_DN14915_c0_g2~~TRINITY_DN14915_c0_g2_i1.p1  ORF type:complete len:480 (+),score=146.47 TRINITY_DN14915_c0_g2_i1:117-1556(+)